MSAFTLMFSRSRSSRPAVSEASWLSARASASLPLRRACLSISAYPLSISWAGSVAKNIVLMIVATGCPNAPTSFFNPLKFMPVLPPTAASTAPSRVVGTFMYGTPRLNVEATKPPRSVTTPPPTFIIIDERVAPPLLRLFHRATAASRFFSESPALTVSTVEPATAADVSRNFGRQNAAVFTSTMVNTDLQPAAPTRRSMAAPTSLV